MDFALTDDQTTIRSLSSELFRDHCTPSALRASEDSTGFDRALWVKLADAGLLGACIPEAHGGLGLGLVELAVLLEEAGRFAAPVPLFAAGVAAAAIVRHGTAQQQAYVLPGIAAGTTLVTAALVEPLGDEDAPTTELRDGKLYGTKVCVPAGLYADQLIVSASTPEGPRLFFVNPSSAGVSVQRQDTITYIPEALVHLDGAEAWPLGDASSVKDVVDVATVLTCALQVGVAAEAVRLTADYTKTREQFGHPIAHFQAVGQRAADAFIDTTTIRLTMLQAVWLVAQRMPADKEIAVAKYFASDAGQRVVRGAAHLHGGMGVSREYPLHRYYLAAKQYELTLGSGTRQLAKLGKLLAEELV